MYVTAHPFAEYAPLLAGLTVALKDLPDLAGEPLVTVAGLITALKPVTTKKGEAMAFVTLEDDTTATEIVVFPETYRQYRTGLLTDTVVGVRGRLSQKNGERKVIMGELVDLPTPDRAAESLKEWPRGNHGTAAPRQAETEHSLLDLLLKLPTDITPDTMAQLKALLLNRSGNTKVSFLVPHGREWKKISTPYRTEVTPAFRRRCQELLGADCFEASPS